MTTLYRPVLIESAEQAEALPVRTPIIIGPFVAMRPDNESFWGMSYSDADYTSRDLVKSFPDYDLTALVPIEAEEETREHPTRVEERPESAYLQPVQQVRYKTRWETA